MLYEIQKQIIESFLSRTINKVTPYPINGLLQGTKFEEYGNSDNRVKFTELVSIIKVMENEGLLSAMFVETQNGIVKIFIKNITSKGMDYIKQKHKVDGNVSKEITFIEICNEILTYINNLGKEGRIGLHLTYSNFIALAESFQSKGYNVTQHNIEKSISKLHSDNLISSFEHGKITKITGEGVQFIENGYKKNQNEIIMSKINIQNNTGNINWQSPNSTQ